MIVKLRAKLNRNKNNIPDSQPVILRLDPTSDLESDEEI